MKLFSRTDEYLLIAVWRLQEDAYGVRIRETLQSMTGKKWSFGTIFVALERLVDQELLTSHLGEPQPVRGGRSKRFYTLTLRGREALLAIHSLQNSVWEEVSVAALRNGLQPGGAN